MPELSTQEKIDVMEERLRDAAFDLGEPGSVDENGKVQAQIAGALFIGLSLQQVAEAITNASRRSGI